jgi:hypothetical protein
MLAAAFRQFGWSVNRGIAVRLIIGMAFWATVHRDWLFTDAQLARA